MSYIILDRDGVINYDSDQYIKSPDEWHPIPGSIKAIAELNQAGFNVLVATNQSGVARGYYDLNTLDLIHQKMLKTLAKEGGKIQEIFFCPHHPDEKCLCRKPKPGLIEAMQKKYHLNLKEIFFIGDSLNDIEAARLAGCQPILVLTGNGQRTYDTYPDKKNLPHFPDLARAALYVISQRQNYHA